MNGPIHIQQAATSHDEIAALASAVTEFQEKLRDEKRYPRISALQQDLHATRQRLAVLFGERHGWHLTRSDFSPSVLARRGLFNGRGYHVDPWPRELVDHGYFYRNDRKAAAVAAHLYGNFDAAKRQDTEATAALHGLRVTWPDDFPSWYLPGRTTLTLVQSKVREVLRAIEDNLLGESMSDVHALVSREFFDKLIAHPKTEEAYKFYAATGAQPLRQDVRRNFPFAGIVFEEYSGTVTLSTKATERLVPASEGIAFPLGTMDTFTTYGGPANLLEAANTLGLPLYARQHLDEKGRWIDLMTEASILPVNKRPRIAIRIHTSN